MQTLVLRSMTSHVTCDVTDDSSNRYGGNAVACELCGGGATAQEIKESCTKKQHGVAVSGESSAFMFLPFHISCIVFIFLLGDSLHS